MVCPRCKAQVPQGASHCPKCGAKFTRGVYCPHCRAVIPASSPKCPQCGKPLRQAGTAAHKAVVVLGNLRAPCPGHSGEYRTSSFRRRRYRFHLFQHDIRSGNRPSCLRVHGYPRSQLHTSESPVSRKRACKRCNERDKDRKNWPAGPY